LCKDSSHGAHTNEPKKCFLHNSVEWPAHTAIAQYERHQRAFLPVTKNEEK
jgi:hypothetical protein